MIRTQINNQNNNKKHIKMVKIKHKINMKMKITHYKQQF